MGQTKIHASRHRAYATPIIASLFSKPSLDIAQSAIELLDLTYLGVNALKPCPVEGLRM